MSLLRGLGKSVGNIFFVVLLSTAVFAYGLTAMTDENTLRPLISGPIKEAVVRGFDTDNQDLVSIKNDMTQSCKTNNFVNIPIDTGEPLRIDCDRIVASNPENIPTIITDAMFNSLYHKRYDCSLKDCIKNEGPKFLISAKAHQALGKLTKYLLIGVILSMLLILISSEYWGEGIKNIGGSSIFIGLMYFITQFINTKLQNILPAEAKDMGKAIFDGLFQSIERAYLYIFIVGIALFAIGLIASHIHKRKRAKTSEIPTEIEPKN